MNRGIILLLAIGSLAHAAEAPWQRQLSEAEAKWRSAGVRRYHMEVKINCMFCPVGLPESRILVVNADDRAPFSAESLSSETMALRSYSSVPELFELIRSWASSGPETVELEFDSELGYPRSIYVDHDSRTTDDFLSVSLIRFEVSDKEQ